MNNSLFNKAGALAGLLATVCFVAATSARAEDTSANRGQLSSSDYKFAEAAAHGGAFEVTLGKTAQEKSTDDSVKQFALQMVTDHGRINSQLQSLASQKGATLPLMPTESQQKDIDKLSALSGADFDKEYISMMVKVHKKDLKEFKHASDKADDADLKSFAMSAVPTIQDHLKMAQDLESKLKPSLSLNQ